MTVNWRKFYVNFVKFAGVIILSEKVTVANPFNVTEVIFASKATLATIVEILTVIPVFLSI